MDKNKITKINVFKGNPVLVKTGKIIITGLKGGPKCIS